MALFFFISGLFGNCYISFSEFISKKSRTLLLPFTVFVIIHLFFFNLSITDILYDNVKNGLWFIYVLFIVQLIDFLCFKVSNTKSKLSYLFLNVGIVLLLITAKMFLPIKLSTLFCISYLATNYPFYLLGRFCKEHDKINIHLFHTFPKQIDSIVQFIAIVSFSIIWGLSFYYNQSNELFNMYLRLSGSISLFLLFRLFSQSKYLDIFSFIGKETLAIYLLHSFFIRDIAIDMQDLGLNSPFIKLLIYSILSYIIAIICIIIAHIIKSNKYLGFFLLGSKS